MRSSAVRHRLRISIRANRQCGCLRIVARHAIAAHAVSQKAVSVPRSSCSCKTITRPVRARPGSSRLIWRQSTLHKAADRELQRGSRRVRRHLGPRSIRPRRCHPRDRIEMGWGIDGLGRRANRSSCSQLDLEYRAPRRFKNATSLRIARSGAARPMSRRLSSGPRQCD